MKTQILTAFALLAVGACAPAKAEVESKPTEGKVRAGEALKLPQSAGTRVEVATMSLGEARLKMRLPGEVKGVREALLGAPMGGYVEEVRVKLGQKVAAGSVLALVDSAPHAAAVEQAKADLELARADLGRSEKMGDLGTAAQRQALGTRVRIAEAGLRAAKIRLARTRIVAPFGGVIADLDIEEGEVAGPGVPAIRLVKLDPVIVELSVSDRDVAALKVGMEVTVIADANLQIGRAHV